jgi:hypothetical protein
MNCRFGLDGLDVMTVLETLLEQSEKSLRSQTLSYVALLSSLQSQDLAGLLVGAEAWQQAPFATVPAHESLRPLFAAWVSLTKERAAHKELLSNCIVKLLSRRAKRVLSVWSSHTDARSVVASLLRKATQQHARSCLQKASCRWRQHIATAARAYCAQTAANSRRCCSALTQWRVRVASKAVIKQVNTQAVQASTALLLKRGLRALQAAKQISLRLQHAAVHFTAATLLRGLQRWRR